MMAAALDACVYPGTNGAEIGWGPLQPAPHVELPAWLAPLIDLDLPVFHWHGDTFDLPPGAVHLAKSEKYNNQAFTVGKNALALQFHPEVSAAGLESWYVGHACELHHAGISVAGLRATAQKHAAALQQACDRFWCLWLDSIEWQ
jgi:GMP synthase (glutamine-hydrolysing)